MNEDSLCGSEVQIPDQLCRNDLRFILTARSEKKPIEKQWESEANYPYSHTTLSLHLKKGGGYGMYPAPGSSLIIIDADNVSRLDARRALDGFPETFTVETGGSTSECPKRHYYYQIDGDPLEGRRTFRDPTTNEHLGEMFAQHPEGGKGYVIGPGSLHPSGNVYRVLCDAPIATLAWEQWTQFFESVHWNRKQAHNISTPRVQTSAENHSGSLGNALNLKVTNVWPIPTTAQKSGDEVKFAHPVHGSTTGTNLGYNVQKDVWHCYRCGSGGDALLALAVDAGIINCEDAHSGALEDPKLMKAVKEVARNRGFPVAEVEEQQRSEWLQREVATRKAIEEECPSPSTLEVGVQCERPVIQINERQLNAVTEDVIQALLKRNDPPKVFVRGGVLVRIDTDENRRPNIRIMTDDLIRYALSDAADYVELRKSDRGEKRVDTHPPMAVARNVLAFPGLCELFPTLLGVIETPTIVSDGRLITKPGYDAATGLYYLPATDLLVPEVPENPTAEDITASRALIEEIICDFPFIVNENTPGASRANALAAMVSPHLRGLIDSVTPLAVLDKTTAGTGASLLAKAIGVIVLGSVPPMLKPPENEAEWEKKLFSSLLASRTLVVFDNLTHKLTSAAFALVLTAPVYEGRLLGRSENVTVPQMTNWMVTGNNVQIGGDIARRCYRIRMDADCARPWQKPVDKFIHPDILAWCAKNRGRIIGAILTLARAWIQAGRPQAKDEVIIGGYEQWSRVVGGVLSHAGIIGFLKNLDALYDEADDDTAAWAIFLERLHKVILEKYFRGDFTAAQLTTYLREVGSQDADLDRSLFGVLPDNLADAYPRKESFSRVLGNALAQRNEKWFPNGFRVKRKQGEKKHGAVVWIVEYQKGKDMDKD